MLTRRKFFSMLMVMGVLFFLFQFLNLVRQNWSSYYENSYAVDTVSDAAQTTAESSAQIVYIGADPEGSAGQAAAEWAQYRKCGLLTAATPAALTEQLSAGVELPLLAVADLSEEAWTDADTLTALEELTEQGVSLVVPVLPTLDRLRASETLRTLLGISAVRSDAVTAKGIVLYDGFLLGGEAVYQADDTENAYRQDMQLTMPWLALRAGTKVYMKANLDDDTVDVQDEPPVLWRNAAGNAFVFVVNGDYFSGTTGAGLLAAMQNEVQDTTVYPVLNAQNYIVCNAPSFADENTDALQARFSQSLRGTLRDVVWPQLTLAAQRSGLGFTAMVAPQLDYSDENEPQPQDLQYYAQQLQTQNGEFGLSGWRQDSVTMPEKAARDAVFWNAELAGYQFTSFWRADLTDAELDEALNQPLLRQMRTVVEPAADDASLIGWQNDRVTRQQAVADGFAYTYRDDLRMRCAETVLGYTSVTVDAARVLCPADSDIRREMLSKRLISNLSTYWRSFSSFEATTATETDARIRTFEKMSYTADKADNILTLTVEGSDASSWFIVRTHHKIVESVDGGAVTELERGAYLVEVDGAQAILHFGPEEKPYYTP